LAQAAGLTKAHPHEPQVSDSLHAEKLKVWQIVLDAQTNAAQKFTPNHTAADVDLAARGVIEAAGYGYGFTHRLGHGIGIKGEPCSFLVIWPSVSRYSYASWLLTYVCLLAHESPYLNKWNTKDKLKPGMTFTNEPGIYLEGIFGVRHEDIYLVTDSEEAELLTGRRAVGPYDP
jgi:Xaa-Pro aminopeptidase